VTFIDVGNGDATLISAADRCVLVDAGPKFGSWSAARRILPVLREQGVEKLDALILTHPDNDHVGGAAELLLQTPVERIFTNGDRSQSRTFLDVELVAAARQHEFTPLSAGDVLRVAPNVTLSVLSPDSARLTNERTDNRKSLVIRLAAGESTLLLPADIDSAIERDLTTWGAWMDVDMIKTPHHGAESSTSDKLLTMTTPEACVISAGRRNQYGHPSPEVLNRLAAHAIPVYSTAEEGTLEFVSDDGTWKPTRSGTAETVRRWKL
jgi:competence protein ComEC